jgi:uncharacterized protein with gpF-like domain
LITRNIALQRQKVNRRVDPVPHAFYPAGDFGFACVQDSPMSNAAKSNGPSRARKSNGYRTRVN